jgi:hypothetical protein
MMKKSQPAAASFLASARKMSRSVGRSFCSQAGNA